MSRITRRFEWLDDRATARHTGSPTTRWQVSTEESEDVPAARHLLTPGFRHRMLTSGTIMSQSFVDEQPVELPTSFAFDDHHFLLVTKHEMRTASIEPATRAVCDLIRELPQPQ